MFVQDHPNARLLERLYRRAPDLVDQLRATLDVSFVCHGAGSGEVGGRYAGLEAMLGHLAELDRLSGGTFTLTPLGFYGDDTWGLVSQVATVTRADRSLELRVAGFWRFSGVGQVAEHWEVVSDEAVWDAFWLA